MATTQLPPQTPPRDPAGEVVATATPRVRRRQMSTLQWVASALASLRLTVVLLVMLTFLVFMGTLAQANHDIWYVMNEGYFRVWIAKIELQTLASLAGVFAPIRAELPGYVFFPGGFSIGLAMLVNLLAAHAFRFKVASRGGKMVAGFLLLAVGAVASAYIVTAALSAGEQSALTREFADRLWSILRAAFALASLAGAYGMTLLWGRLRRPEWFVLAGFNALLVVVACLLFVFPDWQVDDAGMRIVWQLTQAALAVLVLAVGCWLLFAKRSGIVLLHAGVLLLMGHEFYTAKVAVEARMNIAEGETVNYTYDIRENELALVDKSHPEFDQVTVVPEVLLRQAASTPEQIISHPDLPVDIRVVKYSRNSELRAAKEGDAITFDLGPFGKLALGEAKPVAGTGSNTGTDVPHALLELLDKESGEVIATILVSTQFDHHGLNTSVPIVAELVRYEEQPLSLDGKPFTIGLRYRREFKPYSVTLDDFRFDRYVGTNQAKSYSSDIRLVDNELGANLEYKISMNNPLRYRGETFYQADFDKGTERGTILQVVKNEGWMVPYLGCALVGLGMLVHFSGSIIRFVDRTAREAAKQPVTEREQIGWGQWLTRPAVWVPAALLLFAGGYVASKIAPRGDTPGEFAYREFGSLPIVHQGRVKPLDTLARNLLQSMSQRQTAYVDNKGKEKVPAVQWLLDVASGKEGWDKYYVYRIDNLELLDSLHLPRRPGFYRYSHAEVSEHADVLQATVEQARSIDEDQRTAYQLASAELYGRLVLTQGMAMSFSPPPIRASETLQNDLLMATDLFVKLDDDERIPGTLVPGEVSGKWMSLYESSLRQICTALRLGAGDRLQEAASEVRIIIETLGKGGVSPGLESFGNALTAYKEGNIEKFNSSLAEYRELVDQYERQLHLPENAAVVAGMKAVERLDTPRVNFEHAFNEAAPFFYSAWLYAFALLLSALAWLIAPQALGRSATAILLLTLVIHTLAIVARIYISGKPPITNIYTTLVFVGWFTVIAMLLLEAVFKVGIGNFIASTIGFATMLIAHYLGLDGDTFTVLQAVLDTQFWLATHVTTINIGYGATILAGAIGIAYLFRVNLLQQANKEEERKLGKMLYGTLCFALLFSFIGTVLGGLWADDSWGRFWGWDPKENGAMMIVLWNAVILHARWGGMVAMRGAALLSIIGNIITAWSWFGVNQLGEGMHSYGFNDSLGRTLLLFVASQLAILVVGLATIVPKSTLQSRSPAV